MKAFVKKILSGILFFPRYLGFIKQFRQFKKKNQGSLTASWQDRFACLYDNTSATAFDRHYIYHPAWASRILADNQPDKHIDIASTLHFASQLSAFMSVEFYDYRPAELGLDQLKEGAVDLVQLPFADNSIDSLSCMHVVEHIGLGRYGDSLDPEGDTKAMRELQRVLARGGDFLFVVPVGRPRIQFNAHRIYSAEMIVDSFAELELIEFALIPDDASQGGLLRFANFELVKNQNYACGCFHFRKG